MRSTDMRSTLARTGAAVAVAALLAACSGSGEAVREPEGLTAAEACGGFAKDAATTAALEGVLGGDRFEDDLPKPERAVARVREDAAAPWADSYRPQAVTYCDLRAAEGGQKDLKIEVRAVGKGPYLGPELAVSVTSYASGLEAFASSTLGHVYFACRLKAPAHETVVETTVRGPADAGKADAGKADPEQRTRLITLANAAARQVADELGCAETRLVEGVPAKERP